MEKIKDQERRLEQFATAWDPNTSQHCIVCGRPSNGKAICLDARCATELAQG